MSANTRPRRQSRSPSVGRVATGLSTSKYHHNCHGRHQEPAQVRRHPYLNSNSKKSTKRKNNSKENAEELLAGRSPKSIIAGKTSLRSPLAGLSKNPPITKGRKTQFLGVTSNIVPMRHTTPKTKMMRKERELASLKKKAIVNKRKTVFDDSGRDSMLEGSFLTSSVMSPSSTATSDYTSVMDSSNKSNLTAISYCTVNSSNPGDETTVEEDKETTVCTTQEVEVQCDEEQVNTVHDMQCSPMKFETSTAIAIQCDPMEQPDTTMSAAQTSILHQAEVTLRDANCSPLKWDMEVNDETAPGTPELTAMELDSLQQDMDKAAFTRFLQKRMRKNKELISEMELELTRLMSFERLDELAIARLVEDIEARSRENENLEAQLAWVKQEDADNAQSVMFPNLRDYMQTSEISAIENHAQDLLLTPVAPQPNFRGLEELQNTTIGLHTTNMSILQYQNECSMLQQRLTDEEQRRLKLETSLMKMTKITDAALVVKKKELGQTRHALLLSEIMKASNDLLDQNLDKEIEKARMAKQEIEKARKAHQPLQVIQEVQEDSRTLAGQTTGANSMGCTPTATEENNAVPIAKVLNNSTTPVPLFVKSKASRKSILPEDLGRLTYVSSPGMVTRTSRLTLGLANLPTHKKSPKSKKLARKFLKKMGWKKRSTATLPAP